MKPFLRNFRYWLPVLLWLMVIALESFRLSSAVTGVWLWRLLQVLHVKISGKSFSEIHHLIRKAGHFTGYGVLCVLMFRSWFHTLSDPNATAALSRVREFPASPEVGSSRSASSFDALRWRCSGLALGMTLLTAMLDEWHQSFDATRSGTPWDVALDLFGGICFLWIALHAFKLWRSGPVEEFEHVGA